MPLFIFDIDRRRKARDIEHEGFFHGAHNISPENGTSEIDAHFQQEIGAAKQAAVAVAKPIEADLDHLNQISPTIERDWLSAQAAINPANLQVIMPAVVMALGAVALSTEIILLAPSLDLLDITSPPMQLMGACGLASLASVLLHLAWETVERDRFSYLGRMIWRILGGLSCVALVLWGVLRGYQVAFAAELTGNPLSKFLSGHPILASIFYIFITLGAPLVAAGSVTYGARHIRDWYRYTTAKRQTQKHLKRTAQIQKRLEAQEEQLRHHLAQLEQQRREWQHAYLRQHERGQKNGAVQSPFWLVQAKATLSAMTTLLVAWWLFALSPFSFMLPAAAYLAAFLYFRQQRLHPAPSEFAELERVTFAELSADQEPERLPLLSLLSQTPKAIRGTSDSAADRRI